ncbi:MAG: hypothetical protein LBR06_06085 [Bacteroidales bacterium]|jgi:hypothetical protein|nr:hypothetical protein [Bacteroidales bacterium]
MLQSCWSRPKVTPLAEVGDRILYLHEVEKVLPDGLSGSDSVTWVDNFVDKWVRNRLLILQAERNLSPEQKDLDEELTEYRNRLLIYRYKNAMLEQKLDTVIPPDEIVAYYEAEQNEFLLKNSVLKAVYLKIPEEIANPEAIKALCQDESQEGVSRLDEYGVKYARAYDRFDNQWLPCAKVLSLLPDSTIADDEKTLNKRFIEASRDGYYYFVFVRSFRLKGQVSPLEYEEPNIKGILLNKRRAQFLKNIENDVYAEGVESGKFKVYDIKDGK